VRALHEIDKFSFLSRNRRRGREPQGVRYRSGPYLSLLNFVLFCVFMGCLWGYTSTLGGGAGRFGATELQMLMLQSVSMLLLIGAFQMSPKKDKVWRAVLVALAFVALSESSLVALLSPVG
jgi:hypothetical protein